jgi:hypothetical protein
MKHHCRYYFAIVSLALTILWFVSGRIPSGHQSVTGFRRPPSDGDRGTRRRNATTNSSQRLSVQLGEEDAPPSPFAYVFYATESPYACSALLNIHRLQDLYQTKHRIFVMLSKNMDGYSAVFERLGATVAIHDPPQLGAGSSVPYYKDCLLKLLSFGAHRMDPSLRRILLLDADQLVMRNLDHLFELPIVDIAAPRAYWIGESTFAATLLLVMLSDRLMDTVFGAMEKLEPNVFDMDILNDLFGRTVLMLPGSYCTLNSHWETWDVPDWWRPENADLSNTDGRPSRQASFKSSMNGEIEIASQKSTIQMSPTLGQLASRAGRRETILDSTIPVPQASGPPLAENQEDSTRQADLYDIYQYGVVVLHFTALGKPWMYSTERVREVRGDSVHPSFLDQWGTWREEAMCVGLLPLL